MNANFEKIKKYIVIGLFVFASILSLIFMSKVAINYNISDYLDEKTETKISLNILEDEFGMTADVQVMIENISVDKAKQVKAILKDVENVLTVSFDENSADYYKNGNALFVILVDGDEYSQKANDVVKDVKQALNGVIEETTYYGGGVVEKATLRKAIQTEIPFVLGVSLCLVVAIMLITSKSWIEPLVLLLASGVAVLINMGTNVLFGEISYITNAVAAILQLALSVDYSIVLLHSYRKFKAKETDSHAAMNKAVKDVVKPVSASALTTMAGLFALLFMSMKIGFDIGTVLMKGIVVSAIVSLTLFPALLLIFEKPLERTKKKELIIKGREFCRISFRAGKNIIAVALAVIIACGALQFGNAYTFTDSKKTNSIINDAFGRNNSVVVVYENTQNSHEKESALIEKLNAYKTSDGRGVLKNYTAYSNTVREIYDIDLAAQKLQISRTDLEMLYTMYHLYRDSGRAVLNTFDFIEYADELLRNDPDASAFASEGLVKAMSIMLAVNEMMNGENTAEDFQSFATTGALEGVELDLFPIKQMYGLYGYDSIVNKSMGVRTLVDFVVDALEKPELSGLVNEDVAAALALLPLLDSLMSGSHTAEEFHALLTSGTLEGVEMDLFPIKQMYGLYGYDSIANKSMTVRTLVNFVVDALEKPELSGLVNEDIAKAAGLLPLLDRVMNGEHTAEEFHSIITTGALEGLVELDLFPIKQMYGLYNYDSVPEKSVDFMTMVEFLVAAAKSPELEGMMDQEAIDALQMLLDGGAMLDTPLTQKEFQEFTKAYGVDLSPVAIAGIYGLYKVFNPGTGNAIPPIELIKFAVENGFDIGSAVSIISAYETMKKSYTYEEFMPALMKIAKDFTGETMDVGVSDDTVQQLYIMYFFEQGVIPDSKISGRTFIEFIKATAETNDIVGSQLPQEASAMLADITVVDEFLNNPTSYEFEEMSAEMLALLNNVQSVDISGALEDTSVVTDAIQQLYIMYLYEQGDVPEIKISGREFVEFIKTTAETNVIVGAQLPESANAMLSDVVLVDEFLNDVGSYEFEEMSAKMVALLNDVQSVDIGEALEDTTVVTDAIQQLYIMYLYEQGEVPEIEILGREFVQFIKRTAETNVIVGAQLPDGVNALLSDIFAVDAFLSDTNAYDFRQMASEMTELQTNIQSMAMGSTLDSDKILGVYVKYAVANDNAITDAIEAKDLLAFVLENVDTNEFLSSKLTADKREKLSETQEAMASGTALLVAENYSRILLSIDLESESAESSAFVEYLLASVKEVFGETAHVAGEMVSTYDLQTTFDTDNVIITIFTIISIFLIVMLVFRSVSLPILLVAIIQGAIWITMSMSLLTGPMFFMSYIMAMCILMGATIDYGILMATTYVQSREKWNKKKSLYKAVSTAMPTVFTSGMILTICGFVIGLISTQNAIATVGFLIGKGTLVSMLMITLVLPSVLYLLDDFVLKKGFKGKN